MQENYMPHDSQCMLPVGRGLFLLLFDVFVECMLVCLHEFIKICVYVLKS